MNKYLKVGLQAVAAITAANYAVSPDGVLKDMGPTDPAGIDLRPYALAFAAIMAVEYVL